MDGFYARMREAVEGERGTIAKFIGDAVLAVWGARERRGGRRAAGRARRRGDARRARRPQRGARGALGRARRDAHGREHRRGRRRPAQGVDLLVGDTVNVAARLEQAAAAGEVLVGPETARLVRDARDARGGRAARAQGQGAAAAGLPPRRRDGAGARRGAARRGAVRRARRAARAARGGPRRRHGGGRRPGWRRWSARPGSARAGSWPSSCAAAGDRARVLHGRCERTGEGATLLPIAEIVRAAAGIGEHDDAETVAAKLDAVLPGGLADRERIAAVAAASSAPATRRRRRRGAVLGRPPAARGARRRAPGRVVLDDVHWAQPTLLDLLEHLADWGRDGAVLVVALARPELRDTRPALTTSRGARRRRARPRAARRRRRARALVDQLLGAAGLPAAAGPADPRHDRGQPALPRRRWSACSSTTGCCAATATAGSVGDGGAADVNVPPTINALLGARLERLGREERVVVERASVIGHEFWRGAVAELAPEPRARRRSTATSPASAARSSSAREGSRSATSRRSASTTCSSATPPTARCSSRRAPSCTSASPAGSSGARPSRTRSSRFHLEQAHGYRAELGPLDDAGLALARRAAARLHVAGRRALAREDLPAAQNLLARARPRCCRPTTCSAARSSCSSPRRCCRPATPRAAEPVVDDLADARRRRRAPARRGPSRSAASSRPSPAPVGWPRRSRRPRTPRDGSDASATRPARRRRGRSPRRRTRCSAGSAPPRPRSTARSSRRAPPATSAASTPCWRARRGRRCGARRRSSGRAGAASTSCASCACPRATGTSRSPAQHCSAVLEAMRGRADAARGDPRDGAGRRSRSSGSRCALAELDTSAGIVELLADEPAAAEALLARARDGFDALGVDAGAAHASALLGAGAARAGPRRRGRGGDRASPSGAAARTSRRRSPGAACVPRRSPAAATTRRRSRSPRRGRAGRADRRARRPRRRAALARPRAGARGRRGRRAGRRGARRRRLRREGPPRRRRARAGALAPSARRRAATRHVAADERRRAGGPHRVRGARRRRRPRVQRPRLGRATARCSPRTTSPRTAARSAGRRSTSRWSSARCRS